MPSPARRIWLLLVSTILILVVLYLGYNLGMAVGPSDKNLATIEDAWNVIHQDYVDPSKIDSSALSQAAVQAMVDTLNDPHSGYFTAEMYQQLQNELTGQYGGIGASVTTVDGQITIVSVNPGSPADSAGLKAGDSVLEIDGVSTAGMSVEDAVAKVQGPKGTQVTLLVRHQGESATVLITITRADIKIQSISFEMMEDIAYIAISQFTDGTNDELKPVFQQLSQNGARGIILDLRDNPGGPETAVVDVASRFVTSGTILTVRYSDGFEDVGKATHQAETTNLPVVVLVNSNSASEVLSGALQDHGRAVIAGQVTYGKGSIDQFYVLPDGSAIYLTIARWLTPNGHLIEGKGITPDYTLDSSTDWVQWAIDYLHGEI